MDVAIDIIIIKYVAIYFQLLCEFGVDMEDKLRLLSDMPGK